MSATALDPNRLTAGALSRGRSAWRRLSTAEELRRRRVPAFDVLPASGPPTAYYLMPEASRPQGGVRVAYRHVDLLNEMGWSAAVLHRADGHRADWFENTTRVESSRSLRFRANDLLVLAEWFGPSMAELDPRARVLVFNQGAYITFDGLALDGTGPGSPYADVPRLEGIMTVSSDSADLLGLSFPSAKIDVVRPVVDASVFHPTPEAADRVLAYAPSRRPDELHLLLHMLRAVGVDWPLVPIRGMSEREVARTLQRSAIFLSLSDRDGFGLPPAEAMACGAYVIGYTGGGGEEFFDPSYSAPVHNLGEFVRTVRAAVDRPTEELAELGRAASAAILERYDDEGLREDLGRVYRRVLGPPSEEPAT